jgi:hypothetical protein
VLLGLLSFTEAQNPVPEAQELRISTGQQLIDGVVWFGTGQGPPELRLVLDANVSVGSLPFPGPNSSLTYSSGRLTIAGAPGRDVFLDNSMRANLTPQFPASSGRATLELGNFTM